VSLLYHNRIYVLLTAVSVFLFTIPAAALTYTVKSSDTLYGLSRQFEVPVNWIIRANSLDDEIIRPGQKLRIPPSAETGIYEVLPGDTLLGIAIELDMDLDDLRKYNNLGDDTIHPGQKLTVRAPRPDGYEVDEGDSLWTIARKFKVSTDDIKSWNALDGDVIHPGQILVLFPGIEKSDIRIEPEIILAATPRPHPENPAETGNGNLPQKGEYYFSYPAVRSQPAVDYWESPDAAPAADYHRAVTVLDEFRKEISSLPKIDSSLSGWHVVIDPGHGGLDPGAIVSVPDGNGNPVVITEDEYAYDVSMRLYRALYRHGASVSLTVIAPDHHIRSGNSSRETFVHRKNEVYNSASQNRPGGWRPVGTTEGLELRKTIAAQQIRSTPASDKNKGTIYISIHADNTPDLPAGKAVLYDGADEEEKKTSKALAEALVPMLGRGSFTHSQQLRVLENNPADASVLVEVRNIHYTGNAWALRSAELREQDARMIADGIVSWAGNR